jgi:putative transposase
MRTAVQAPRMNAICERLAGTLRRELLDRSPILGAAHLRAVLAEYQEHYNAARPHQGIDQRIPDSAHHPPRVIAGDFGIGQIRRKPGLSGLINEYERAARHPRSRSSRPRILFSSGTGARLPREP